MIGFIIVDEENYVNIEHSPETSKLSEHYFHRPICQKASLCVKAITVTIKVALYTHSLFQFSIEDHKTYTYQILK